MNEIDVMPLGQALCEIGFDEINDGFWIWDIKGNKEYYSPVFRERLGFEGEADFPSVPASWMKQINPDHLQEALIAYEKHKESADHPYFVECDYTTKQGNILKIYCIGSIVNRNDANPIMLGTHQLRE